MSLQIYRMLKSFWGIMNSIVYQQFDRFDARDYDSGPRCRLPASCTIRDGEFLASLLSEPAVASGALATCSIGLDKHVLGMPPHFA